MLRLNCRNPADVVPAFAHSLFSCFRYSSAMRFLYVMSVHYDGTLYTLDFTNRDSHLCACENCETQREIEKEREKNE